MSRAFTDIAFTPTVRQIQKDEGSADLYAKMMAPDAERRDQVGRPKPPSSPPGTGSTRRPSAKTAGLMSNSAAARTGS